MIRLLIIIPAVTMLLSSMILLADGVLDTGSDAVPVSQDYVVEQEPRVIIEDWVQVAPLTNADGCVGFAIYLSLPAQCRGADGDLMYLQSDAPEINLFP